MDKADANYVIDICIPRAIQEALELAIIDSESD